MVVVIGIVIGLAVGAGLAFLSLYAFTGSRLAAARRTRQLLVAEAKRDAEAQRREAQIEAREESVQLRADVEQEIAERRSEILKIEERVLAKEEDIDRKLTELARREQGVSDREVHTKQLQEELKETRVSQLAELERVAGMTVNEAKAHLLERSEELIRHELARRVRQAEEEARAEAKRRARNLVADALQRVAANHASETTVSLIELPVRRHEGPDHRPRGPQHPRVREAYRRRRDHRRHAAAVVLSSLRRHPPRDRELALDEADRGRPHPPGPDRGDVYQSKAEIEEHDPRRWASRRSSRRTAARSHEELVKILGRLRFRTSYGQNVLKHTLEVVHLAGMMAAELEASVKTARRAALLHDIGKALTTRWRASHAMLSAQYARRYGESPGGRARDRGHHDDIEPQTVEAVLLIAADAISASRPGRARREPRALHQAARGARGGRRAARRRREGLRDPGRPRDPRDRRSRRRSTTTRRSCSRHEIAREIEEQLEYPGQIKVTVIRESRAVEYAK